MTVNGYSLEMTRGDTESITVSCEGHPFEEGDIVEMTVRKRASSEDRAFYKRIDMFNEDGSATIPINPEDTADLSFGSYMYDIQLTFADGTVATIIKPNSFVLLEEVTYGRIEQ